MKLKKCITWLTPLFMLVFAATQAQAQEITWSNLTASAITASGATLSAEMSGNDGNVTAYWTTNTVADPATHAWEGSDGPAAAAVGTVSRTVSSLTADTLYSYAFYGTNSTDAVEAWSEVATFATALSAAQNPAFTAVEVTSSGTLSVSLAWTDNASTETAYVLQRSSSGSTGPYAVVATLPSNSTSHVDYVMPSTTYHYRLSATNSVNATSTDPATCQSAAITTISAGYATGGNRFATYSENGTNFVAHIFTEDGTFEPRKALDVEYLIVGGGGGGGGSYNNRQAGGGGAGGLLTGTTNATASPYAVIVGAGGLSPIGDTGYDGGDSSAFGRIGEGGGGGGYAYTASASGRNGGCGGGGSSYNGGAGGTGSQGGDGAQGDPVGDTYGGGGGGANGNGLQGVGGAGHTSFITGTSVIYAVGGAGGLRANGTLEPGPASAYTGNGGEGGSNASAYQLGKFRGGDGGSGVVVIRYQVAPSATVLIVR